jgi:hypothetical protein
MPSECRSLGKDIVAGGFIVYGWAWEQIGFGSFLEYLFETTGPNVVAVKASRWNRFAYSEGYYSWPRWC